MEHNDQHSRPVVQRARSHSTPSQGEAPPSTSAKDSSRPHHAHHDRSHSLQAAAPALPQDAASKPPTSLEPADRPTVDKPHRIHLPGRHNTQRGSLDGGASDQSSQKRRSKLHRYTQSLADQHHFTNSHTHHGAAAMSARRRKDLNADSSAHDSLPNLVAGLNAERNRQHHPPSQGPSSITSTAAPSLNRVMSTRSYRGIAATDALHHAHDPGALPTRPSDYLRRRATSDPRGQPLSYDTTGQPIRRKTSIELDLERAERLRRQRRFTVTPADISAKDTAIATAEDELRESLQKIQHTGTELTRRLDYSFYNLLEKVGGVASVIHSFQTLAQQSKQLVANLESEGAKTDEHIRHRAHKLAEGFEERDQRIVELETRQREVQQRAKELGDRLERARNRVEAWEKMQIEKEQVWGRFWGRVRWCMVTMVVGLVCAVVLAKGFVWRGGAVVGDVARDVRDGVEVILGGDIPLPTAITPDGHRMNGTQEQQEEVKRAAMDRVPEDVKQVMMEIEDRSKRKGNSAVEEEMVAELLHEDHGRQDGDKQEPAPMRVLDEL